MRATATPWSRIGLIYASGILGAMQTGLVAPIVPLLQHDLGLSLAFMGWILSAITAIAALLGTVAGAWTERIGLARAIKGGLLVMAAVAVLGALADSGGVLLATRIVLGFGYLGVVVAGPPLISRLAAPEDRSFALAIWGAFVPIGIALAEGLAGQFLDSLGWRGLFWGDAAIIVAFAIPVLFLLHDVPHVHDVARGPPFWRVYLMRGPLLMNLAFLTFAFAFMIFAGMEPAYLTEARGVAAEEAGRIVALATLCGIPGSLMAGWLIRKGARPARLALIALVVPALASLLIFLPGLSLTTMTTATVIAFLVGGMMPGAIYALLPLVAPEPKQFAPVNGLLTQLGSFGSLIGPPIFATWTENAGWDSSAVPLIVSAALGCACVIAVARISAGGSSRSESTG